MYKAPINNPPFAGAVNGITKCMVGLGDVDNTADAINPILLRGRPHYLNKSVTLQENNQLALKSNQSTVYTQTEVVNALCAKMDGRGNPTYLSKIIATVVMAYSVGPKSTARQQVSAGPWINIKYCMS